MTRRAVAPLLALLVAGAWIGAVARAGDDAAPAKASGRVAGIVTVDGRPAKAVIALWSLGRFDPEAAAASAWVFEFRPQGTMVPIEALSPAAWLGAEAVRRIPFLLAGDGVPEAVATTDEKGRYVVPWRSSDDHLLVRVRTAEGHVATRLVRGTKGGVHEGLDVSLADGSGSLRAVVRAADGHPVPGILGIVDGDAPELVVDAARLDDAGRARFDRLARRGATLRVVWGAADSTLDVPNVAASADAEHTLRLPPIGDGTTGVVVTGEADEPIAGALVEANVPVGEGRATIRARSKGDGTFRLELDPALVGEVSARADGYEHGSTKREGGASLRVRLAPRAVFRGRVVADADGAPVSGVRVVASFGEPRAHAFGFDAAYDFVRTGPDGTFSLRGHGPARATLVVYGSGWMSAEVDGATSDGYGPPRFSPGTGIELRAVRTARLEGTVRDPDGRPVAGATLSLSQTDAMSGMCGTSYSRSPVLPWLPDPESVTTDGEGRYVFDTVKPGLLHHLHAARDHASASEEVVAEAGEPTVVDLVLRSRATAPPSDVEIVVTDADGGGPLAGARVWCFAGDRAPRATGSDGVARFDGMPGEAFGASVELPGYTPASVWISDERPADAPRRRAVASLRRVFELRGRVVDSDGRPLPTATVYGRDPRGHWNTSLAAGLWLPDGTFRIDGAPAGEYVVSAGARVASAMWTGEWKGTVGPDTGEIRVIVVPPAPPAERSDRGQPTIEFRPVGPDGAPARGGSWRSRRTDGVADPSGWTDLDGSSFRTTLQSPRGIVVDVVHAHDASGRPLAPTTSEVVGASHVGTTVELRLEAASSLSGRVSAAGGAPVRGTRVVVSAPLPGAETASWAPFASAYVGADGTYRIDGLGRATYRLTLDVPPTLLAPAPKDVAAPSPDVDFVLAAAVRPVLTVVDEDERPVANAVIEVGEDATKLYGGTWDRTLPRTGPRGRATTIPLDPAKSYGLLVSDPQQPIRFLPWRREGWTPADLRIVVAKPVVVAGRLVGSDGRPVPGAWIDRVPSEDAPREQAIDRPFVDAEGAFRFPAVPRGETWLRVGVGGAGPSRVVRVVAPVEELSIVVDAGPTLRVRLDGLPESFRGLTASLRVASADGSNTESAVDAVVGPDRVARFPGLPTGRRLSLYAFDEPSDRLAWAPDLVLSETLVVVETRPAGRVRGRVRYPTAELRERGGAFLWIEAPLFRASFFPADDGTFELRGVPPGRWSLCARVSGPDFDGPPSAPGVAAGATGQVCAEVAAGDDVELAIPMPASAPK